MQANSLLARELYMHLGGKEQKERVTLNNVYLPLKYSAARFEISACF